MYAETWARDWRRVLLENLEAYGGPAVMCTVTAPGATPPAGAPYRPGENCLPWDRAECLHGPEAPCSGRLGCRVEDVARRRWNGTFTARWKKLWDAAMVATIREVGRRPAILCRGFEAQRRGALHAHVALGYLPAADRRAGQAFARHLNRLAPMYGFGYVDRKLRARDAREAAAYLSRYFVGAGDKAPITEAVRNPELPLRPLYVSRKLTGRTRVTMRNLRRVRHAYAWRKGWCPMPEWLKELTPESAAVGYIGARLPVPAFLGIT